MGVEGCLPLCQFHLGVCGLTDWIRLQDRERVEVGEGLCHSCQLLVPSHAGVRTEQDLYVRLIDSVTKQVRLEGSLPMAPYFLGLSGDFCLLHDLQMIHSMGFTLLFTSSPLLGSPLPLALVALFHLLWGNAGRWEVINEGLKTANNY